MAKKKDTFTGYDSYDKRKKKRYATFRPLTKAEILALNPPSHGKIFFYRDKVVSEVKINGRVRTWKRDPNRIEVPIKYGLYSHAVLQWSEGQQIMGNNNILLVAQVNEWQEPGGKKDSDDAATASE